MSDERGVHRKYVVSRTDGTDKPGKKHHGCRYFVLDIDHDRFAIDALRAYAEACKDERPQLSKDLTTVVEAAGEQMDYLMDLGETERS